MARPWTKDDDQRLRAEMERRFAERTPAQSPLDGLPTSRVGHGEMRGWAKDVLGAAMPETDAAWLARTARWYRSMGRRICRASDEPWR
jgi:hypothetical protein